MDRLVCVPCVFVICVCVCVHLNHLTLTHCLLEAPQIRITPRIYLEMNNGQDWQLRDSFFFFFPLPSRVSVCARMYMLCYAFINRCQYRAVVTGQSVAANVTKMSEE